MLKRRTIRATWRVASPLARPLHSIYEKILEREIKKGPIPRHIGIIPDGNRRWARFQGFQEWMGHVEGYKKMKEVLRWLLDLGVEVVTIFAMSNENCLRRKPEEREKLFQLIARGLRELVESKEVHEYEVNVRPIGRRELWPPIIKEAAEYARKMTERYNKRFINIAICYGGRQEIVDAVKRIVKDALEGKISVDEIDEETFSKYLYTGDLPDPDLIIRTSGEERISNFLLWQSAYSEFYFVDSYWPEFRRLDLLRAIRDFQRRQRRFGR